MIRYIPYIILVAIIGLLMGYQSGEDNKAMDACRNHLVKLKVQGAYNGVVDDSCFKIVYGG